MQAKKSLIDDADCEAILNWLEVHSVSLVQGLPLYLLQYKWRQSGRAEERLSLGLKRLMEDRWIALTPGLEPPHLRFTVEGYSRLLETMTPQPELQVTSTLGDAPARASRVVPLHAPAPAPLAPKSFVSYDRPLTEVGLRNQIVAIYREQRLRAGSRLVGITLSRYWQEMGLRAGDLRTGLELLMRDGYLRQRLDGMDVFWVLTPEGEAYMRAPVTNDVLLSLAPPIGTISRAAPDAELRQLLLHLYLRIGAAVGSTLSYPALQAAWAKTMLDEPALVHALDLLVKDDSVRLQPGPPPLFALSLQGQAYAHAHASTLARLAAKLTRVMN